jgi:16S rRNA (guanine966-N2)-methyltransferase
VATLNSTNDCLSHSMRIVAGKLAGRDLVSPQDRRVRPTAEHVRVAMIDMVHDDLKDARVLELFAGTGAIGLEALSRGARSVDFVEFRPDSLHALRANIAALRLRESTRIFKRDAIPYAAMLGPSSYDIAFADPPYESRQLDRVIASWKLSHFSRILVVEHAAAHEIPRGTSSRTFDDTTVTIYRA